VVVPAEKSNQSDSDDNFNGMLEELLAESDEPSANSPTNSAPSSEGEADQLLAEMMQEEADENKQPTLKDKIKSQLSAVFQTFFYDASLSPAKNKTNNVVISFYRGEHGIDKIYLTHLRRALLTTLKIKGQKITKTQSEKQPIWTLTFPAVDPETQKEQQEKALTGLAKACVAAQASAFLFLAAKAQLAAPFDALVAAQERETKDHQPVVDLYFLASQVSKAQAWALAKQLKAPLPSVKRQVGDNIKKQGVQTVKLIIHVPWDQLKLVLQKACLAAHKADCDKKNKALTQQLSEKFQGSGCWGETFAYAETAGEKIHCYFAMHQKLTDEQRQDAGFFESQCQSRRLSYKMASSVLEKKQGDTSQLFSEIVFPAHQRETLLEAVAAFAGFKKIANGGSVSDSNVQEATTKQRPKPPSISTKSFSGLKGLFISFQTDLKPIVDLLIESQRKNDRFVVAKMSRDQLNKTQADFNTKLQAQFQSQKKYLKTKKGASGFFQNLDKDLQGFKQKIQGQLKFKALCPTSALILQQVVAPAISQKLSGKHWNGCLDDASTQYKTALAGEIYEQWKAVSTARHNNQQLMPDQQTVIKALIKRVASKVHAKSRLSYFKCASYQLDQLTKGDIHQAITQAGGMDMNAMMRQMMSSVARSQGPALARDAARFLTKKTAAALTNKGAILRMAAYLATLPADSALATKIALSVMLELSSTAALMIPKGISAASQVRQAIAAFQ
jgi:hypothetical protein